MSVPLPTPDGPTTTSGRVMLFRARSLTVVYPTRAFSPVLGPGSPALAPRVPTVIPPRCSPPRFRARARSNSPDGVAQTVEPFSKIISLSKTLKRRVRVRVRVRRERNE